MRFLYSNKTISNWTAGTLEVRRQLESIGPTTLIIQMVSSSLWTRQMKSVSEKVSRNWILCWTMKLWRKHHSLFSQINRTCNSHSRQKKFWTRWSCRISRIDNGIFKLAQPLPKKVSQNVCIILSTFIDNVPLFYRLGGWI